jgi:dGTPase
LLNERPPIEAQLIDFVDEIAYNTADLDDGYEAHILTVDIICGEVPLFAHFYEQVERSYPQGAEKLKFNEAAKRVLNYLATGLIENTQGAIAASGVQSVEDVRRQPRRLAGFSKSMAAENAALKKFLIARLYSQPAIVVDRERSVEALEQLFNFYVDHPEAMPKTYADLAEQGGKYRVICDYIAGMTDHYLLRLHAELLGTKAVGSA